MTRVGSMGREKLERLALGAVDEATKRGASQAAAVAGTSRAVSVQYRDSRIEVLREARSASLAISLYVEGRYSSHSTSDLRDDALRAFIDRAIGLTRLLGEDPHRGLADPGLYEDRPTDDLGLVDPGYEEITAERRKELAMAVELGSRSVEGPIVSVASSYTDQHSLAARVHSNGFMGTSECTQFWLAGEVSVRDVGDRKPEEWRVAGATTRAALREPGSLGVDATRRALSRLGQRKLGSKVMNLVLDQRVAGSFTRALTAAMSGVSLNQKRSFLLGKIQESIGGRALSLVDDPLLHGGFGSRHFDSDGISAHKRALVDEGVLRQYLVDVYHGRKIEMEPTGGTTSNLCLLPGTDSLSQLIAKAQSGVYVTGLLGGNSDGTTGDFSHGIVGFEIIDGELGGPVGEMNITGTHSDIWHRLIAVGDDPYPYSTYRVPSLVFEGVAVSGS